VDWDEDLSFPQPAKALHPFQSPLERMIQNINAVQRSKRLSEGGARQQVLELETGVVRNSMVLLAPGEAEALFLSILRHQTPLVQLNGSVHMWVLPSGFIDRLLTISTIDQPFVAGR